MPEGPELARSRDVLRAALVGRSIVLATDTMGGRYKLRPPVGATEFAAACASSGEHAVLHSVDVKGKFMWWELRVGKDTTWYMMCTYGMTGQWILSSRADIKHRAATWLGFDGVPLVSFVDQRRFGTLTFTDDRRDVEAKLDALGPDMLNDPPDVHEFTRRLVKYIDKTVCQALMDQRMVSGVGNYLKSESLYRARLSPYRKVGTLTRVDAATLYAAIVETMRESYLKQGTSFETYVNPDGSTGMGLDFNVYLRKYDPAGRAVVRDVTDDERATWWCPELQH